LAPSLSDTTVYLKFDDNRLLPLLFGEHDQYLGRIEEALHVTIVARGNHIAISGRPLEINAAQTILNKLYQRLSEGMSVSSGEVDAAIRLNLPPKKRERKTFRMQQNEDVKIPTRRRVVMAHTVGQAKYIQALQSKDLIFAIGPAGTGKTYLAVATGVSMLLQGKVDRIILSRPAVEAGEHLGFLPGDLREKIDPYLRPLYDALHDMLTPEQVSKRLETGEIEIAPLAFMRGRTLSNAYVILDEGQNTTIMQMKMFLTRLGEGSSMVVTGDLTQIDLPKGQASGLQDAVDVLQHIDEIDFIYLDEIDTVRHPLVKQMIKAYAKADKNKT